ncbi:nucleoid-associated protein [Ferroacidibacillus organovorans]|uniref:nucleoid-associated protein n=1 Tax=Ferroacidibacillus organovorans TaxID=1765683 RepID=UPI001F163895|nr:nucleoid-associated protein [Ferroacidibacillus organovorans]
MQISREIAKHLYESSSHPRIRGGEFFMLYFTNCSIDGVTTDAIGIFKSETKDTYLKISPKENTYGITLDEGISINRLEKGCLIFNLDVDIGYRVAVIDNLSKSGEEARYWKGQFLGVRELGTDDSITKQYMSLVTRVIDDSFPNGSAEHRIKTQLKAMSYFDSNVSFDDEQFTRDVLSEWPTASEEYNERKRRIQDKEGISLPEKFTISRKEVERVKRSVRRTIQLDDSFELVIKAGAAEVFTNLKREFDEEKGMFYYKVYFTSER